MTKVCLGIRDLGCGWRNVYVIC